jgi:DNA-directed RNA polymerase specialized sigma24 family protein
MSMRLSLAKALDLLTDSTTSAPDRSAALRRVSDALHALAAGEADRQEAAQVVMLRLHVRGPRPEPGRTEARAAAYLRQALVNALRDELRRSRRHRAEPLDENVAAPAPEPEWDRAPLHAALARLDQGDVPRALVVRRRADHRQELLRGIAVRARQLRWLLSGLGRAPLTAAEARASRRAALALRQVYAPNDTTDFWMGRLAWLDLRALGV